MQFDDPTAVGGVAKLTFIPDFDRVPSTGELVTSKELGRKYFVEVCKYPRPKFSEVRDAIDAMKLSNLIATKDGR